jgi:hypothetical protein
MPANRSTKPEEPTDSQEMGRILRFEPRRASQRPRKPLTPPLFGRHSPVESVDKYARGPDDGDDYRYRMRANVAAVVVVGLLIWCGYWLFNTLTEMRKTQDCILSGRTNCAQISVPIGPR